MIRFAAGFVTGFTGGVVCMVALAVGVARIVKGILAEDENTDEPADNPKPNKSTPTAQKVNLGETMQRAASIRKTASGPIPFTPDGIRMITLKCSTGTGLSPHEDCSSEVEFEAGIATWGPDFVLPRGWEWATPGGVWEEHNGWQTAMGQVLCKGCVLKRAKVLKQQMEAIRREDPVNP